MCRLNEREQQVINMRNMSEATFKDIGERFGFGTERARQIYYRALKKKRILKEIEEYCPEFFRVQREMPLEQAHFYRLYSILKKHRLVESGDWAMYDDWDWLFIPGIGKKYLRFLNRAKELRQLNHPLQNRR